MTVRALTQGKPMLRLNAPTQIVFWISLILVVIALIGVFVPIAYVTAYAFWIAIVGYIVLAAGCLMKGT
jgi:hypothetical protein